MTDHEYQNILSSLLDDHPFVKVRIGSSAVEVVYDNADAAYRAVTDLRARIPQTTAEQHGARLLIPSPFSGVVGVMPPNDPWRKP